MTMKFNLKISGILLLVAFSLAGSLAQSPGAPTAVNPATGLPVAPVAFDPTTGQPIQPGSDWRDFEPDITLSNVSFADLPISEVARYLEDQFKGEFDIVLPTQSTSGAINPLTGLPLENTDWTTTPVRLQLRHVVASEVFNAMNLMFENDHTPLRWELKMNGNRPIALLRVLTVPNPNFSAPKNVERRVYFVGNLIGDEKSGGMTMEQIIKTITDVWKMADVSGGNIQFHKDAQLLVVTGTQSQIDFMEQTLSSLKLRTEWERFKSDSKATEAKSKTDEPKPAPAAK
jgi:hypothetical protein